MKKNRMLLWMGLALAVLLLVPAGAALAQEGGDGEAGCDADHPQIARIAEQFDVPVEEVAELFCAGYNVGQIKQAYRQAEELGVPVSQILEGAPAADEGEGEETGEEDEDAETTPGERCTGGLPAAQIARLAEKYGVDAEEIEAYFCAGYGLGVVKIAYELAALGGYEDVAEIFAMVEGGMSWGEVRQSIEPVDPLDEPEVEEDADEAGEEEEDEVDEDGMRCDPADLVEHPTVLTLAGLYEVEAEEIAGWFCMGYGLGEIRIAYSLADALDMDAEEVFALRDDGGWGAVKRLLRKPPEPIITEPES
jgi:hypothetical protein